uniref:Protein spinster homolog 1 n=1 Tax=Scleropages formosus TaxID=113540 RepID=A0A8C9TFS7_SCLFO
MSLADPSCDSAPFFSDDDDDDEGAGESEGGRRRRAAEEDGVGAAEGECPSGVSPRRAGFIVAVLCYINLLNYMDRFTVAGVLPDIEQFFGIADGQSGLLQTVFICSYMFLAPIFGYLGDRYNRKFIMCGGITFWTLVTLASSYTPKDYFWALLLTRGLVGVGEASYSTIAPTIIADLFVNEKRTKMLSIFYFAIPVGSGLGYIVGSKVDDLEQDWHWALRVTPALGLVAVLLLLIVVKEPKRGAVEARPEHSLQRTSWLVDIKALGKNLYFGVITCVTGFLGVASGVALSGWLRKRNPRADPLVCAAGLLLAAPFLFLSIICAQGSIIATYVFIFFGETFLSMNWAIVADILLYVVVPTRRSTAEAFQIVLSHLFGDAGSPYLIGVVSDALRRSESYLWQFRSLQISLLLCCFVAVLGGASFLATALFIEQDRDLAEQYTHSGDEPIVVPKRGRSTKVPVSSVLI